MRLIPDASPPPLEQHREPPVAEPAPLVGQIPQPPAQRRVGRTLRPVAHHLAIRPGNLTRPPLRQPEKGLQMRDSLRLRDGRHHYWDGPRRGPA